MNWMNLPPEYSTDNSKFVILPIEYEKEVTFGTGASKGSAEIIKASKHLEYYDEEFDNEPFLSGVKLLNPLQLNSACPEEMIDFVSKTVLQQKDKFIIGLGGDHAVTIGLVKGQEQLQEDFSVLVLDAHADFRDSWNGSNLNHACVAKQLSKKHEVFVVGVRSMDKDEALQIVSNENVQILKAHEFTLEKFKQILPQLKKKVYLSIDVDVFDPSIIRNTGTPEPGGLYWDQMIDILRVVFHDKEVIGADVVEFAPQEEDNYSAEAYSLAKLVYKMMALYKKI